MGFVRTELHEIPPKQQRRVKDFIRATEQVLWVGRWDGVYKHLKWKLIFGASVLVVLFISSLFFYQAITAEKSEYIYRGGSDIEHSIHDRVKRSPAEQVRDLRAKRFFASAGGVAFLILAFFLCRGSHYIRHGKRCTVYVVTSGRSYCFTWSDEKVYHIETMTHAHIELGPRKGFGSVVFRYEVDANCSGDLCRKKPVGFVDVEDPRTVLEIIKGVVRQHEQDAKSEPSEAV